MHNGLNSRRHRSNRHLTRYTNIIDDASASREANAQALQNRESRAFRRLVVTDVSRGARSARIGRCEVDADGWGGVIGWLEAPTTGRSCIMQHGQASSARDRLTV